MTIKAIDGGPAGKPQLRKSLKLWQVVMMGLAYLTPMTVFDTFGIVSGLTDGHVPTSYLLALAGVLFTAISYGKLVRQFPTAGSAYTYAQKAINPHVGFLVGWSSLLDYLFLPMINTLLAKIYLTALFPEVPPFEQAADAGQRPTDRLHPAHRLLERIDIAASEQIGSGGHRLRLPDLRDRRSDGVDEPGVARLAGRNVRRQCRCRRGGHREAPTVGAGEVRTRRGHGDAVANHLG